MKQLTAITTNMNTDRAIADIFHGYLLATGYRIQTLDELR
jgi:hypothetical protein